MDDPALYAPMTYDESGYPRYAFPVDHPAHGDDDYTRRRNRIAFQGAEHVVGTPAPEIDYHELDHQTWRNIQRALAERHAEYAAADVVAWAAALDLPTDHVPQLEEVNSRLRRMTGYALTPAVGFVPIEQFYGVLADEKFYAAQFIRHHSQPFFSPEADVVHELVGHSPALGNDKVAELYRLTGEAVRRVESPRTIELISRVFWFTLEYGVIEENGLHRAYGAGLLSSFGELESFRKADIRPLNLTEMATTEYDITDYQHVLFAGRSIGHVHDFFADFLRAVDDEDPDRIGVSF
ncbi:phenylalanine 4-monooxygenase [Amycolatopsis tolypomycina]|uniref:Phenylalanine 4-hydroxylase n=1 Tax=Amycolatopsis tolypomycina TaxID=208445 RepID=A0A1H4VWM2_9PSEU|nr:phenylalanine 4-monooxygenase [Amycolatopsis tolypomycina]SEC84801.1 Phenylalanine 4-hydroxylase [Amycolatopsis tolypomycina]